MKLALCAKVRYQNANIGILFEKTAYFFKI